MHKCHLLDCWEPVDPSPPVTILRGTVKLLAFIVKDNWLSIFKQFKTRTWGAGEGGGQINAHPFLMRAPVEITIACAHHKYHRVKNIDKIQS